jgi:tripartite-type tricarboxylate transporter receptor subunit TctC
MEGNMELPRRQFLHLGAGAVALPALSRIAAAQNYPTHPVRIVVPLPVRSSPDIRARVITEQLTRVWGRGAFVENWPGGGGVIGAQAVLSASPDGHTLLYAASTLFTVLPAVKNKLPFDLNRDFIPIGLTAIEGITLGWSVLLAPRGTLPAVVQQLGEDLRKVLDDPDVRERFEKIGGTPFQTIYTADVGRFIESEQKLWWPIVREATFELGEANFEPGAGEVVESRLDPLMQKRISEVLADMIKQSGNIYG